MNCNNRRSTVVDLLARSSALAIGVAMVPLGISSAHAQAASSPPAVGTPAVDTVVVTGSRIQTADFKSPTPLTTLGVQEVEERAAVSITDILFTVPSIVNSTSTGTSTEGQSSINLRGLSGGGNTRTLVLVDGQRPIPNNQYGGADTSVIPTELVQRTDIVTGGGSAAYGSDAIAGVVNIILRDKLEGFRGDLQYGQSQRNDNKSVKASLAWGAPFAGDRGQFMVAGEYSHAYGPQAYSSRDWSSQSIGFTTQTINGITYTNAPTTNLTLKQLTTGGVIIGTSTSLTTLPGSGPLAATSPLYGIQFGPGGAPIAFNYGNVTGITSNTFGVNGSGAQPDGGGDYYYGIEQVRSNIYARATYQVADNIKLHVEGGYAYSDSSATQPSPNYYPNGGSSAFVIPITNPYLQALTTPLPGKTVDLAQAMAAANIQTIAVGRLVPELGNYTTGGVFNVYSINVGLDGSFSKAGKWSFAATTGGSYSTINFNGNPDEPNLRAAADPIVVNGQIVCNPSLVAAYGASPGCVPLNVFGPGSISPAAAAYIYQQAYNDINNTLSAVTGSIQDDIISLWAGPITGATGLEWRRVSLSTTSSAAFNLNPLTFNYGQTAPGGHDTADPKNIPYHQEDVEEAFAEVLTPLLAPNWRLGDLAVDSAVRVARYSVNNTDTLSWKIGATYSPALVPGLLLRVSESQDTRAPNLSELFTGNRVNSGTFTGVANSGTSATSDPLQPGVQYGYTALSPGNPALVPEVGHTITYGFTYSPEFVRGLGFSIDWYDITIDNEINNPGAANIILGCYGQGIFAAAGPQQQYCALITRVGGPNTATNITTIDNLSLNIAAARQQGIDFEIHYATDLARWFAGAPGHVNFRMLATDKYSDTAKTFANLPTVTQNAGLAGDPKWKVNFNTTYAFGDWSFNMLNKYVSSVQYILNNVQVGTTIPYLNNNIAASWVTDIQLSRRFKNYVAYLNVTNLFDANPPAVYSTSTTPTFTSIDSYDIVGRAFRAGVRFNF